MPKSHILRQPDRHGSNYLSGGSVTGILLDQGLPRSAVSALRDDDWDVLHTGYCGFHIFGETSNIQRTTTKDDVEI